MKKIAFGAVALLFSLIATAGEPMATMKYVTNQVNRLDGRIDAAPTYSDVTNIAKTAATPEGYDIVSNKAMTAVQPGDRISVLTNDLNFVDETITNGLITATNAMAYADQVGEDTLEKTKEEMERQGLVNTNDLKLALAGKRDKSDVKAYVSGSVFDLSKIDADCPAVSPFACYPAKVSESPARYVWLLVDKNGNVRKSSEAYNTQTALMSAKTARFSYGANTYTVTAKDKPADYSFVYTGDGSGITDFTKTPFGNLATEPFVTAKAEEIIESKGFATEDFVTGNYYDKTTVDNKISGATPGNYETVSNNAINALMRTDDTFKGTLTVASSGVSGKPFGVSVSKGGTIKLDGQDVVYGVNVNGAGFSGGNIELSIPTSASDLEAYNKAEVDGMVNELNEKIEAMTSFEIREVDELPERGEPGIIYLVPDSTRPGNKLEYTWTTDPGTGEGKWTRLGDTTVDLSEYAKKATTLAGYGIGDAYTKTQTEQKAGEIAAATNKYVANIRATAGIGVHKVDAKTGYVDLAVKGMSMQQALEYLVSQRLDPGDPTYPSITAVNLTGAGAKEVGDTFTPSYSITVSTGKYDYGPDPTGSTFDQFLVTDSLGGSKTTQSGSFDSFTVLDSTDYRVSAKAHYTQGAKPLDNKGGTVEDASKRIQAYWWNKKTTSSLADAAKSAAVTGYRKWYTYAGTSAEAIDSTFIRTKCTDRGNGKTAASIAEMTVPDKSTRVMIALPKVNSGYGYKKTVISVIDIDGMGLDIIEKFAVSEVSVNAKTTAAPAMTYTVWTFANPKGIPATRLNVVIADTPMLLASVKRGVNAPRAGDAPTYQPAANLNVALARQFEGPLDVSAVFYKAEDLDYYITKGRESEGISPYWIGKTPYPYAGQIVSLVLPGCSPTNYLLKANADSEFDKVQLAIGGDLDDYAKKATTLEGYGIEDAYDKTETESLAQSAEDNAKAYTDEQISKIEPASFIQIPTGRFTNEIVNCGLYHLSGEPAGDSYMTNVVINPDNGYPVRGSVVLNGTFAGHEFHNEKFDMLGGGGDTMIGSVGIDAVTYTMSFKCPLTTVDPIADKKWGLMKVARTGLAETTDRYMHYDYREFRDVEKVVDTTPNANHTNSLITSKAVADVAESVGGKLSKSGDTATGDFTFDDYSEVDGWILPSFGWSGAKSYQVGTASKDGVTYEGGIGVGVSEPFKSNIKFPVSFRIRKQAGNEISEVNYTEDGVSEGSMTTMPPTPMEYRTVSFQKDEDGKLRAGTFALDEDYRELPGIVQGILDNGATKVQNKLAFKTSAAATADLASFDGSSELKVVKGENMKFTTDASSLTIDVDTNKVATVDFAKAVVPTWVATPDSETRFVTRMSGDGRRQKKRPIYKVKYGSTEYEFNLSHMTKFEVDEDGAVESMQFVNGNRVLDFQYGYVFYFWPDYRSQGRYYYVGKERGPYFSDDAYMAPVGGLTADTWLTQTGCDGGWYNAGSILDDTLSADDYRELDGRIDETAQGAHDELVAVSNSLMLVRSDRIYNMGKTGRFARYRVTRQQFGNTYVFDFELRADNKRDVSTGTWYDGTLIEQRQGGTPESLTFRMIAYNGTYAGNYAFYISIDGNAETTEKMPLPTELFPMAVGETKNLGVMTVQKLSQGDQVVDSYLYGDLTIRKTQDDSIKDRVPTSSEFDFSGDLFRPLTSADDVERVKTVLNAVIEKLKAVGQIEKGN